MKATARLTDDDGAVVTAAGGNRTKVIELTPEEVESLPRLPSPAEAAAAREAYLHERYHKVADDWNDYLDRLARGEDPFGPK